MTIYVVLHEDRHCDPELYLFYNINRAITKAREIAADYEDAEEEDIVGWHYNARLSEEGDHIRVTEHEVQT